jgi:Arc/MetJ-type ribon-helix-helix transcriptional regulator
MHVVLDRDSEKLVEQQLRAGRYHSAEEIVARALEALAEKDSLDCTPSERRQAVLDMLEFADKHGFTLGGLRVRDLIHEGHKY